MPEELSLSHVGAFVPFPAFLLDEQMPRLKDTEWRLLCIIVRQTLGWQSGRGRKRRDWMSQRQLIARTGRNSAALSEALDSLVRKNLVECSDQEGTLLLTSAQRRQHRGRVYFTLSPVLWNRRTAHPEKSEVQAKPTLNREIESTRPRIHTGWTKAAAVAQSRNYPEKSEVQKANWTKET